MARHAVTNANLTTHRATTPAVSFPPLYPSNLSSSAFSSFSSPIASTQQLQNFCTKKQLVSLVAAGNASPGVCIPNAEIYSVATKLLPRKYSFQQIKKPAETWKSACGLRGFLICWPEQGAQ